MGEDPQIRPGRYRRRVAIIAAMVLAGGLIPWLLQDPNYKVLDRLPMLIDSIEGLELSPTAKLIARQGKSSPDGELYFAQYTFAIENQRRQTVHGIRLQLRGLDAEDGVLFIATSKPRLLDIDPGKTSRAFLRARGITPATIQQLHRFVVTVRTTPPSERR